mmetsp:Transcript_21406/g.42506  ORF Transcript_21406/g.42506 Transcript_21406/m.42506 type:complete len:86 (+) Transcript_21406:1919-2176(+)
MLVDLELSPSKGGHGVRKRKTEQKERKTERKKRKKERSRRTTNLSCAQWMYGHSRVWKRGPARRILVLFFVLFFERGKRSQKRES